MKKIHWNALGRLSSLVAFCASTAVSPVWAFTINSAFTGATEPGWTYVGTVGNAPVSTIPLLTAAPASGIDPVGSGWLRLTQASNSQSGSAIYNTAFPSADGVQIEFDYAIWGGDGADGFTFYLIDGSVTTPTTGASDGSLGYSSWPSASRAGVTKGYVGVGFDEWGNYTNSAYGGGCAIASCGPVSNSIAVRGAGNLLNGPYASLPNGQFAVLKSVSASPIQTGTSTRGTPFHVRITITAAPSPSITVERDTGAGYVKVIDALSLANNGPVPSTFKMGFSAGTGSYNNNHEIRLIKVQDLVTATNPPKVGITCAPATLPDSPNQTATCTITSSAAAVTGGLSVNLTVPASGSRNTVSCPSSVTIAAGTTTASETCTVTAVANTVVGDGSVPVTLSVASGTGYTIDSAASSATVTIVDDDVTATPTTINGLNPIPTVSDWVLALLSLSVMSVAVLFSRAFPSTGTRNDR